MDKERKLIIAGNWKMNKTVAEGLERRSERGGGFLRDERVALQLKLPALRLRFTPKLTKNSWTKNANSSSPATGR